MKSSNPELFNHKGVSSKNVFLPLKNDSWLEAIKIYRFENNNIVRFVPEGRFEILIQFGGAFYHRVNDATWAERPKGFVGGLHNQSYEVRAESPESYCLGIKIKPAYSYDILQSDLPSMKNCVIDLRDVWGKKGNQFIQAVYQEDSLEQRINKLLEITNQIRVSISDHRRVEFHSLLEHHQGVVKVSELAKSVHLSESQFRKIFKKSTGMNAKDFCKITRIQRIAQILRRKTYEKLSDIAYDYGYFDQAHMIKDFKAIIGQTPSQFTRMN